MKPISLLLGLAATTIVAIALAVALSSSLATHSSSAPTTKPNIVVVIVDDQDVLLGSMEYMHGLKTNLQDHGTTYNNHFCTVSLCCPSRVTLWTGKAAHNTNVTDLSPPYGGYPKFIKQGYNDKWLPVWLQQAGYKTYYTGKLMNSHSVRNYDKPPIHGLDGHDFLLEPGIYRYLKPIYQRNDQKPKTYHGNYTTTLLIQKSLKFLDEGAKSGSPFFLVIAPVAPHADQNNPPIPEKKYKNLFPKVRVPRGPNFNPKEPSGANFIRNLPRLNHTVVAYNDEWHRQRLRALQSVDDLINKTIAALDSYGILENTYIIYTSDNGFHISQHRLMPGKREPYEEDIRVPLIIRGPGIPSGAINHFVSSHMDLAPTMLSWAGATSFALNLDGQVLPITDSDAKAQNWEHVQVEHWGPASHEGKYVVLPPDVNNTYKALRVIGKNYNLYYSVWCTGEHELYDMTNDLSQMNNLINGTKGEQILGVSYEQLKSRLDALLLVLKSCEGNTCSDPWTALHPEGNVKGLKDALEMKYNDFYQQQNKVNFEDCANGYFPELEQPLHYYTYTKSNNTENTPRIKRDLSAFYRREFEDWLKWSD